jgi:hypothetical protein
MKVSATCRYSDRGYHAEGEIPEHAEVLFDSLFQIEAGELRIRLGFQWTDPRSGKEYVQIVGGVGMPADFFFDQFGRFLAKQHSHVSEDRKSKKDRRCRRGG